MKPLYDKIYVKLLPREEKTAGGIYLPDDIEEKIKKATVIAVGQGRINSLGELKPLIIKPHDIVMFGRYAGTQVDDDHVVLREDEILGVIEEH